MTSVSPPGLLTMIEAAVPAAVNVHFVPSRVSCTLSQLWRDASVAARWLDARVGPDAPVAAVLDSSPEAIAVLLGAWRAGRRLVSIPLPPRAATGTWYQSFLGGALQASGAELLVVAGELIAAGQLGQAWPPADSRSGLLPSPTAVPIASFEEVVSGSAGGSFTERPDGGELVQFTSGTTGDPRGITLGMAELGANVRAILEVTEPQPGDGTCSWLPLSHDMGLIGCLLASLCSYAPDQAGGGDLVLIRPDWFLRRPEAWLQACHDHRSTITAAPDFGFAHAVRRGLTRDVDLSRIRMAITGAERVRASTLQAFADTFAGAGFAERALSPAYGMAEVGVAVTMVAPGDAWSTLTVDAEALAADGEVRPAADGEVLVSCGPPLRGYEVRRTGGDGPVTGPLELTGPSLSRACRPGGPPAGSGPGGDGSGKATWLRTNDIGFVHGGELYVVGRGDDVVVLGGRNVYLGDVDAMVADGSIVRPGRVQSVRARGGFSVVAEAVEGVPVGHLATIIRRAAVGSTGWRPDEVVVVERGTLPRTASGKARRGELCRNLEAGELAVVHRSSRRS